MLIQTFAAVTAVGSTLVSGAALLPRVRYTTTDIAARGESSLSLSSSRLERSFPLFFLVPSFSTSLTFIPLDICRSTAGWSYPVRRLPFLSSIDPPSSTDPSAHSHDLRSLSFSFPSPGSSSTRCYHARCSRYRHADRSLWRGICSQPNELPSQFATFCLPLLRLRIHELTSLLLFCSN